MFNKKIIFTIVISLIIVILLATIYFKRPNEAQFVQWLKDDFNQYNFSCLNSDCSLVSIDVPDPNTNQPKIIEFINKEGDYDYNFFQSMIQRQYVSRDREYFFFLTVEGFWGTSK